MHDPLNVKKKDSNYVFLKVSNPEELKNENATKILNFVQYEFSRRELNFTAYKYYRRGGGIQAAALTLKHRKDVPLLAMEVYGGDGVHSSQP